MYTSVHSGKRGTSSSWWDGKMYTSGIIANALECKTETKKVAAICQSKDFDTEDIHRNLE